METCEGCGRGFETKHELKRHSICCGKFKKIRRKYVDGLLTYEFLYENLITNGFSSNHVANVLLKDYRTDCIAFDASVIIKRANLLGIKTYSVKEATNLKITREKYVSTCKERYGDTNALGRKSPCYSKRNASVKEKYGVENVFQLDEVKSKSKKTCMDRYGSEYIVQTEHFQKHCRNNGRKSLPHKIVEDVLIYIGVSFISESNKCNLFKKYNKLLEREYSPRPDIILNDKNIVIEIYGDLWHGNPERYKETDLIPLWGGDTLCCDKWEFDARRVEQIESFGYEVIVLWETYIKKNKHNLKEILCKKLKLKV